MTSTTDATDTFPIFLLEITDEDAIVLPAELRGRLGVGPGDVLAVVVVGNQARISEATKADAARTDDGEPVPQLEGLLQAYFIDREDVRRFIEDERRGWEEREATLGL